MIIAELIFENVFRNYEAEEIVALLSCFIFQERFASEPKLTPRLETVCIYKINYKYYNLHFFLIQYLFTGSRNYNRTYKPYC